MRCKLTTVAIQQNSTMPYVLTTLTLWLRPQNFLLQLPYSLSRHPTGVGAHRRLIQRSLPSSSPSPGQYRAPSLLSSSPSGHSSVPQSSPSPGQYQARSLLSSSPSRHSSVPHPAVTAQFLTQQSLLSSSPSPGQYRAPSSRWRKPWHRTTASIGMNDVE